jgi:hypothetical protein
VTAGAATGLADLWQDRPVAGRRPGGRAAATGRDPAGGATAGGSSFPECLLAIEGVVQSPSTFSDRPALWVNGKEIVHRDASRIFDVRLTRAVIRQFRQHLREDRRVRLRPSSSADWVEVQVTTAEDDRFLKELVERAAQAHRPPPGTDPAPPPVGAALARRRRFH